MKKYIKNKNWTNKNRLTTVALNSSTIELSGKRDIAIASILFLRYLEDYGIVIWLWSLFLIIEILVTIYILINAQKLITTKYRGCIVGNLW